MTQLTVSITLDGSEHYVDSVTTRRHDPSGLYEAVLGECLGEALCSLYGPIAERANDTVSGVLEGLGQSLAGWASTEADEAKYMGLPFRLLAELGRWDEFCEATSSRTELSDLYDHACEQLDGLLQSTIDRMARRRKVLEAERDQLMKDDA